MKISLVWLRRNLRVRDNRVLSRATSESDVVIPLYIWDATLLASQGGNRLSFLRESVIALSKDLEQAGVPLVARCGDVQEQIAAMVRETGATTVYADRNYELPEIERDRRTEEALQALGALLVREKDNVLFESHEVRTKEGKPYTIFTPFKKAVWERVVVNSAEATGISDRTNRSHKTHMSQRVPALSPAHRPPTSVNRLHQGGSAAAQARWEAFKQHGLAGYKQNRDLLPAEYGTSQLSPHIRFGTISVRQLVRDALALAQQPSFKEGAETFISELLWREFYHIILAEFPHVAAASFKREYDGLRWQQNESLLEAWKAGRTGVPIVDAAMRQLLETGWMHNRARMIVASFLTKDLLINWQEGELHFMRWLTDGDLALNNGGWQWSASTGTDAQPYYRIFNPYLQSKKFDPDGVYIKRYVPELRSLPTTFVHEPHLMTAIEQSEYGCVLGKDYPFPIVDHSVQREKARAMFERLRERT